eukprot:6433652-Prorocentrum_lima.AAC.1
MAGTVLFAAQMPYPGLVQPFGLRGSGPKMTHQDADAAASSAAPSPHAADATADSTEEDVAAPNPLAVPAAQS